MMHETITAPRLEMIPTHGLRQIWPMIRERLDKLADGQPWISEEVFAEVASGNTYLWATPHAQGFVVLQLLVTAFERVLHVWIAVNGTDANAADFVPQLLEIAASHQCDRLTWESTRKGWERAVPAASVRYLYTVPVGGEHGR